MAKSRRRGGPLFAGPSGTLPPPSDTPLDAIEDLPGRYTALVDGVLGIKRPAGILPIARAPRTRFPAKQVHELPRVIRRSSLQESLQKLRFYAPSAVKACHSRRERREVLFARRKAGFSGSARKKHWRRTAYSQWRC